MSSLFDSAFLKFKLPLLCFVSAQDRLAIFWERLVYWQQAEQLESGGST